MTVRYMDLRSDESLNAAVQVVARNLQESIGGNAKDHEAKLLNAVTEPFLNHEGGLESLLIFLDGCSLHDRVSLVTVAWMKNAQYLEVCRKILNLDQLN